MSTDEFQLLISAMLGSGNEHSNTYVPVTHVGDLDPVSSSSALAHTQLYLLQAFGNELADTSSICLSLNSEGERLQLQTSLLYRLAWSQHAPWDW